MSNLYNDVMPMVGYTRGGLYPPKRWEWLVEWRMSTYIVYIQYSMLIWVQYKIDPT